MTSSIKTKPVNKKEGLEMKISVMTSKKEKGVLIIIASLIVMAASFYISEKYKPIATAEKVAGCIGSQTITQARNESRMVAKSVLTSDGKYIVKKGDTIWSISKKFNVHQEELRFTNYLGNSSSIVVGQKLTIPNQG